jgi:hypothetical protein
MLRTLAERGKLRPRALVLGQPTSEVSTFFSYIILDLNKNLNLNNFVFEQNSYLNKNLNLNKTNLKTFQILAISENCSN